MSLETGNYISDLVITNPTGLDDRSQGDDHIRLIKKVLKQTFPNIDGPVTGTDEQLNAGVAAGAINFPGMIVMWSGLITAIPAGWKVCDGTGTTSTGSPVPDLRNRFIVGTATNSGGAYNVGNTGGSPNIFISGVTGGTAITVDQMPPHNHPPLSPSHAFITNGSGTANTGSGSNIGSSVATGYTGGGLPHDHTVNLFQANANIPPYYALAFIIKL